jgi:hypothetical protein
LTIVEMEQDREFSVISFPFTVTTNNSRSDLLNSSNRMILCLVLDLWVSCPMSEFLFWYPVRHAIIKFDIKKKLQYKPPF